MKIRETFYLYLILNISPWKLICSQMCEEYWVTLLYTVLNMLNPVGKDDIKYLTNKKYLVKLVPDLRHIDLPNSVTTWYLPLKSSGT